jgi:uncharacterized protein YjbI with pentapeptide repeats
MHRNEDLSDRAFDGVDFADGAWDGQLIVGSEFIGCAFGGASLASSELRACRFVECTFARCDFAVARLVDSFMTGCTFEDCRLPGIDWPRGRWADHQLHGPNAFERCDLSMGVFDDLDLSALVMTGCKVRDASFRGTKLIGANLQGSDLDGTDFTGADLSHARLTDTPGLALDPRLSDLTGATVDFAAAMGIVGTLGVAIE